MATNEPKIFNVYRKATEHNEHTSPERCHEGVFRLFTNNMTLEDALTEKYVREEVFKGEYWVM